MRAGCKFEGISDALPLPEIASYENFCKEKLNADYN